MRWTVIVLLVVVILLVLILLFQAPSQRAIGQELTCTQLLQMEKSIRDVTIRGNELSGHDMQARSFFVRLPADPAIATRLADAGVVVLIGEPPESSNWLTTLLVNGIPLLLGLLWLWPLYRIARTLEQGVATRKERHMDANERSKVP